VSTLENIEHNFQKNSDTNYRNKHNDPTIAM